MVAPGTEAVRSPSLYDLVPLPCRLKSRVQLSMLSVTGFAKATVHDAYGAQMNGQLNVVEMSFWLLFVVLCCLVLYAVGVRTRGALGCGGIVAIIVWPFVRKAVYRALLKCLT